MSYIVAWTTDGETREEIRAVTILVTKRCSKKLEKPKIVQASAVAAEFQFPSRDIFLAC